MKTWKKIILILGSSLCLLGLVIAAIGQLNGGIADILKHEEIKSVHKTLDNFDTIDLQEGANYNFIITSTNAKQASISYYTSKKGKLSAHVNQGKLTVKGKLSVPNIQFFNLSDLTALTKGDVDKYHTVKISIPKGMKLSHITSKLTASDLTLKAISVDNIDSKLDAGDLYITNSKLATGNIKVSTGDFEASDSQLSNQTIICQTGDVNLEHVQMTSSKLTVKTGDISADDMTFKKTNHLDCSLGDINLSLANYDVFIKQNHHLDDESITNKLKPSNDNVLELHTNTGDITVD